MYVQSSEFQLHSLIVWQPSHFNRNLWRTVQDVDDEVVEVVGDLTKEDLMKLGFSTGNAIKFLKALATTPAAPQAAVGGNAATIPSSSGDP
jgi:hypothetical protein